MRVVSNWNKDWPFEKIKKTIVEKDTMNIEVETLPKYRIPYVWQVDPYVLPT